MAKYASRVEESVNGSGTGNLTLTSNSPDGFRSFGSVFSINDYIPYVILDANGIDWERGYAKLDGALTVFARSFVMESSNSNNLVNLSSGDHRVFCSPHIDADKFKGYTVGKSGTQSIPHNTATNVSWDTVVDDEDGFITPLLPLTHLVVPAWVDLVEVTPNISFHNMVSPLDSDLAQMKLQDLLDVEFVPPIRHRQSLGRGTSSPDFIYRTRAFAPRTGNGDGFAVNLIQDTGDACVIDESTSCQVRYVQ